MLWKTVRPFFILIFILLGFALLLLLPQDIKLVHTHDVAYKAESLMSWKLYKDNILNFYHSIIREKGFGKLSTGILVSDDVIQHFMRSLKILLPSFLGSIVAGTFLGTFQFRFQHRPLGKIFSFINWIFASIPDFFVYILLQYLLIKMYVHGLLPDFHLFGNEDWYTFIFPSIALAIYPIIHIAKFTFISLRQESEKDYVKTSAAKGMTEFQVLVHMLRNCSAAIINQIQIVMLYIMSSLPVFEKLTFYNGAGFQLVKSIQANEDGRALALMIPFLILMAGVIALAQFIKFKLLPVRRGEEA
jgi:oligopeptide transport system permease protein